MENLKFGMATVFAALLMVGCSNQTRDEYSQAGAIAGKALDKDVAKGVQVADAAGKAAKKSLDEDKVKGEIESKQLSDASVTPKIKSALATANDLHSAGIHVETVGKKVILSGAVPTAQEKKRAQSIATSIAGPSYKIADSITVSAS